MELGRGGGGALQAIDYSALVDRRALPRIPRWTWHAPIALSMPYYVMCVHHAQPPEIRRGQSEHGQAEVY